MLNCENVNCNMKYFSVNKRLLKISFKLINNVNFIQKDSFSNIFKVSLRVLFIFKLIKKKKLIDNILIYKY
jgi:hypothetical protein